MAQVLWHKPSAGSSLVMQRENLWVLRKDKTEPALQRERKVQGWG